MIMRLELGDGAWILGNVTELTSLGPYLPSLFFYSMNGLYYL